MAATPILTAGFQCGVMERFNFLPSLGIRAYAARSYLLALYLNTDARLDSLHADPRYQDLLRRMKLPSPP